MLAKIFGTNAPVELLGQGGSMHSASNILREKKYLLLYFSASWCPPCRIFTPQLATFYENFHKKHNFEVIFISQDKDERSMLAYFYNPKYSPAAVKGGEGSHGDWWALTYQQSKLLAPALMRQHNIRGIPTLIIFDLNTGEVITRDARQLVVRHANTAEGFPWIGSELLLEQRVHWQQVLLMIIMLAVVYYYFIGGVK